VQTHNWRRRETLLRHVVKTRRVGAARLMADWSDASIEASSARAEEILVRAENATAVLLYGTNYFPARGAERARVPVGAALDTTFAQLARMGEGWFQWLTPAQTKVCVEHQRNILLRCDALFPRSRWCLQSLIEDYGADPQRCVVTGAGPNWDHPPAARPGERDGRTLLFVGRDWIRKGGPLVLDAFRLARRARPDLRLVVVGPALPDPREPGVEWLGPLDGPRREELLHWYQRASLYLCVSRAEPFGIALLEAMASGCPVVALDRGAAKEIVRDGETGTLLAEAEPWAVARAIQHWLSDPAAWAIASATARTWVSQNYSWEFAAERIARAFDGREARAQDPRPAEERSDGAARLRPTRQAAH
jgi:glycosyltransferase involved in cell wall biosynthesis